MKTDSGLEYFHRIIRQPLATLAGCKAPLRHGRWYVAINYASVPIRDRSNPIERILHQCIQLVSPCLKSRSFYLIKFPCSQTLTAAYLGATFQLVHCRSTIRFRGPL